MMMMNRQVHSFVWVTNSHSEYMKRAFLLVLTVFLTVVTYSQDVVVTGRDSLTKSLDLDNLRKISFKDGTLITTYSDGSTKSIQLTESDKLQFTAPEKTDTEASEEIVYAIYDLSGRIVKTNKGSNSVEPFDLNDLTSGIYLLRTGNRTIKIVR